nr:phage/plasmid primase, P4 family [Clostridium sp. MCC344]
MEEMKPSICGKKPTIRNIYSPRCHGKNTMETDDGECIMHSLPSAEERSKMQEYSLSAWPVHGKETKLVPAPEKTSLIMKANSSETVLKKQRESEKAGGMKLMPEINVSDTDQQSTDKERFQSSSGVSGRGNETKQLLDKEKAITAKVTVIVYEKQLYFYNGRTYELIHNPEELMSMVRERVSYDAFGCVTTDTFRHLLKFMQSDKSRVPPNCEERIAEGQYYVVFQNGVLDLRTLELHEHSPNYLTFYELQVNWTESCNAPAFQKFLQVCSCGDEEVKERIIEALGYMLTPLNHGKCFFVMGSAPNSGKSTLGNLLIKLLGENLTITRSINQLGGRFGLADIEGKLLNLCMDLPNGKIPKETVSEIKCITGGDKVTIEGKFKDYIQIHSNMNFLFASNFPVVVAKEEDDDSFWDRMVIIPFIHSVAKDQADQQLIYKLMKEKEQIISLCLTKVSSLIENNFIFSPCYIAEKMKQNWRYCVYDSTMSAQQFAERCLQCTGNSKDYIYVSDLYESYKDFCADRELDLLPQVTLMNWICTNLKGCIKKRYHETGKNAMSAIRGIAWK